VRDLELYGQIVAFDLDGTLYRGSHEPIEGAVKRVAEITRHGCNRAIIVTANTGHDPAIRDNLQRDFPSISPQDIYWACGSEKPQIAYGAKAAFYVDNCYEICITAVQLGMLGVYMGDYDAIRYYSRVPIKAQWAIQILPNWESRRFDEIFTQRTLYESGVFL